MKKVRKCVPLDLEKRNEWFNNLTRSQKKVQIAKELLWALKNDQFKISKSYFNLTVSKVVESIKDVFKFKRRSQIQNYLEIPVMEKNGIICSGCAIAGLFYAAIRLGDNVKIPDDITISEHIIEDTSKYYDTVNSHHGFYAEQNMIHYSLNDIFTRKELRRIETAYESNNCIKKVDDISYKELMTLIGWNIIKKLERGNSSLVGICQNIIDNKGEFVVELKK